MNIDYSRLPEHMQDGARLYIERGVEPGGFLSAVLSNDFVGAFSRADSVNQECMADWARWLYSDCPRPAWGSRETMQAWIAHDGFAGLRRPRPMDDEGIAAC